MKRFLLFLGLGAVLALIAAPLAGGSPRRPVRRAVETRLYPVRLFVPGHVYATPDPLGSGKMVTAFAVSGRDQPYPGSLPRADLYSRYAFGEGSDYYMSVPIRVPTGLPRVTNAYFFQWFQLDHAGEPSNPIMDGEVLAWDGDRRNHYWFRFMNTGSTYPNQPWYNSVAAWRGPAVDGKWHTLILHVHFTTGRRGTVQLWWDGARKRFNKGAQAGRRTARGVTLQCARYLCPDGLDINQYRSSGWFGGTVTIYHGTPRYGPTYQSVADGLLGATGP